ncbi:c-type cytochrome [Hyphomonas johnsonii]|uniref:Cytochrome c signal peptide protein n=1 Tax=Hyphomonas johnsonii MHS-2 TaxID=1280950 RepID=A0A059FFR3_9PROT|nr:cytochrome c [Hyphomonas johnsonii]KCZ89470.1 cytochrome c signal peptide protein [Hyphomonas johnsonii MHS-2]
MTPRQTPFAIAALAAFALLTACGSGDSPAAPAESAVTLENGLTARETIEARQAHLKNVGKAFKTISDNLKAGEPDLAAIQAAAAAIPSEVSDMDTWFPAGSGPDAGVKTAALAVIWEERTELETKITNLQSAAATLDTTAQAGDIAAIAEAFKATGATCKSCHDKFRAED